MKHDTLFKHKATDILEGSHTGCLLNYDVILFMSSGIRWLSLWTMWFGIEDF